MNRESASAVPVGLIALAGLLLALATGCSGRDDTHAGVTTGADNPSIDALFTAWDKPGSPGCALAVARDGKLLYSRGYGYANLDYDIPITPQTVFDVASVNKQFMAALINMLALEGRLSLDDNVRKWLPELPEYGRPMTLRHMIYHTSGLRDYLTLFPLAGRSHYYPISQAQILAMMSRQRALNFPPGERYEYSNSAYMLLAQVIERASGRSLARIAAERIFEPLGMHGSLMYDNYEQIIPRRATGYDRHDEGDIRMVHNFNFDVPGDGQLYSTVEDLLRWDDYLHGREKPPIYAAMLTEGTLNSGESTGEAQGLVPGEYRGVRTVHHTGSSWGSTSILIRFVEPGLAIAIACNDGLANRWPMVRQIADHYLADDLAPLRDSATPSAEQPADNDGLEPPSLAFDQLEAFTGTFHSAELDAIYRFAIVDDRLVVRIEQEPPLELAATASEQFLLSFDEQAYSGVLSASLTFDRDASGTITGFTLSSGNERGIVFEKLQ